MGQGIWACDEGRVGGDFAVVPSIVDAAELALAGQHLTSVFGAGQSTSATGSCDQSAVRSLISVLAPLVLTDSIPLLQPDSDSYIWLWPIIW